jgi:hypothetical protein
VLATQRAQWGYQRETRDLYDAYWGDPLELNIGHGTPGLEDAFFLWKLRAIRIRWWTRGNLPRSNSKILKVTLIVGESGEIWGTKKGIAFG